MSRSHWKPEYNKISLKISQTFLKISDRSSLILPFMLNKTFSVYNGLKHIPVTITENMLYHKTGEFSLTRAIYKFKKKEKKKKK